MYVDMHKRITFGPYVINLATFRRVFFRHIINETIHQICSKIESVEKSTKHMGQKTTRSQAAVVRSRSIQYNKYLDNSWRPYLATIANY